MREADDGLAFVPTEHKLQPPRVRPDLVDRSALIGRLRSQQGEILAVTAPAGYGKTTLIAEWATTDERPCAWLSLDATDNDPAVLMTYLALALDQIEPVDPAIMAVLSTPPASMATALPRFARLVADIRRPFVLVLDDVHQLLERDALDVLAVVVADLQPGSSLALVGRALPPLRFGRLRVKRDLVEVGVQDLAFDANEVALMFAGSGLDLDAADVATLVERTEGWPAGLYLAVLALKARPAELSAAVADFAGDHRLVADYLRDELLADLEPDVATFLLGASCLERLSGPLCDAVLERTGSAALLDELQRQNLLITPLDDRREWYRLHHLFAELLHVELRQREPAMAVAIHTRASEWFEARGDIDSAVNQAWRADDRGRTESLMYRYVGLFAGNGRHSTIRRWLSLFPADALVENPLLAIIVAHTLVAAGDGDGAVHWLERAEAGIGARHPARAKGWAPPVAAALLRAMVARLPVQEMLDEAVYAYRRLPHGDWHALSSLLRGAGEFMLGNEEDAEELLAEGLAESSEIPTVHGLCLAHLAVLEIDRGRWAEATVLARRGRDVLAQHSIEAMANQFLVTAVSCLAEAHDGHIPEAEADRQLTRRHLLGFLRVAPWANMQARLALARADMILGDRPAARVRLNEVEAYLVHSPGALRVKEQIGQIRREWPADSEVDAVGPSSLTMAELRVLSYLPTHLTLAEIADRLYVSRNTVKSQTIAIYRKLGTSSRAGAVGVGRSAGLLDDADRII